MAGDLGFFVAGEGEDFCAGAFLAGADAEEFESLADEAADEAAVLADASGEYEEVESAEFGGVSSDEFLDRGGEDVDGEGGVWVSGFHGGLKAAHVGFSSGEGGEAGLAVEESFERVGIKAVVAHKEDEDARVEVSGAGGHGDAAGGGESHAGVDGAAVEDGDEAGSVAEMGADDARGGLRAEAVEDGFIRESVKAVSLNAFAVELLGDGVAGGGVRDGGVEGGIEAGELLRSGQESFGFADERKGRGDVQRGEVERGFERCDHLRRDALMLAEVRASVDDAMADCGRRGHAGFGERVEDGLERGGLRGGGAGFVSDDFLIRVSDGEASVGTAYVFGFALVEGGFVVVVVGEESELEGRGAAVDGEDECVFQNYPSGAI